MKIKTLFCLFLFSSALAIGQSRPNVIIVMADDMGWSDIGCYGSEIETPNFSVDLSNQVALVTGASSGLGYRFSKVLAKCGAKVALSARRVEKLESLAEEIQSDGGECMVVPIDMVDRESIRAAVKKVEEDLGTINTLINNAGMVDAQWAIDPSGGPRWPA